MYLAWDERLCAAVACKLLRPDRTGDEAALRRLRREARILGQLAHPAIVRSFHSVLDGARPHVVLEYLGGPNLRRRLRRKGSLSLDEVLQVGLQVGGALHYLEARGLVHLDVKPSNLVLAGRACLLDFSLSRRLERARTLQRPVGTTEYMAPELCAPAGTRRIGPPADVWGLGATLYEALCAKRPFPAAGAEGRYPQLDHEPTPLAADAPAALAEAILRCLRSDPRQRPKAAEVVAALAPLRGRSGE